MYTTRARTLLQDYDFVTFSQQLFPQVKTDFTLAELAAVAYIEKEVHVRLQHHIHTHRKLSIDLRSRYCWDYARHNISRVIAWKAMTGVLDLTFAVPAVRDPLQCFIRRPEACMLEVRGMVGMCMHMYVCVCVCMCVCVCVCVCVSYRGSGRRQRCSGRGSGTPRPACEGERCVKVLSLKGPVGPYALPLGPRTCLRSLCGQI